MVSEWTAKLNKAEGERNALISEHDDLTVRSGELLASLEVLERAQALIQDIAKETQDQLRFHLQDLVNGALEAVFPGVYKFHIDFVVKNGSTSAEIYLEKDGERTDPMKSTGGGVVDLVAFALRLVAWSIGKTDNVIILDEPMKHLSATLKPLASEMIKRMSELLKIQIIMVTHDEIFAEMADRVFEVSIDSNGVSHVKVQDK